MKPSLASLRLLAASLAPLRGLLATLLLASLSVFAQGTGAISGVVLDSSGKYLEGAEVTIAGTTLATTTEREGVFRLAGVAPGAQTVRVAYPGMTPASQAVNVTAGQTAAVRVQLKSDTIVLEGLAAGERVVVGPYKALDTLRDGMRVTEASATPEGGTSVEVRIGT